MSENGGRHTARRCHPCGHLNRPKARFCSACGLSLVSAPRKKCCTGGLGKLFLMGLVGVAAFAWFGPAFRSVFNPRRTTIMVALDLPREKAEGLYELLKPKDIKVLVGPSAGYIEGTHAEVEALGQFVELLTRLDGLTPREVRDRKFRLQHEWTSKRTYKLRRSKARALHKILRVDDVPVGVDRDGSKLVVWATPEDQAIISNIADILRGRQPQPSARCR